MQSKSGLTRTWFLMISKSELTRKWFSNNLESDFKCSESEFSWPKLVTKKYSENQFLDRIEKKVQNQSKMWSKMSSGPPRFQSGASVSGDPQNPLAQAGHRIRTEIGPFFDWKSVFFNQLGWLDTYPPFSKGGVPAGGPRHPFFRGVGILPLPASDWFPSCSTTNNEGPRSRDLSRWKSIHSGDVIY